MLFYLKLTTSLWVRYRIREDSFRHKWQKIHLKLIHNIKEFVLGMSNYNPDLVLASSQTWFSSSKRCLQSLRFSPSPFHLLTGFLSGLHAVRPEFPGFPMVAKWLPLFQTSHLYTTSLKRKRASPGIHAVSLFPSESCVCPWTDPWSGGEEKRR